MTRIVNIGEALIDEITRPNSEPVEVVGGSMLNVAAGLTRLGHESELATWFSRDARGGKGGGGKDRIQGRIFCKATEIPALFHDFVKNEK